MKKEFIGYYIPTEIEINTAWEKGNFVFDTNALLNLYRYSESTRKDFLNVLQKLSDKLFLPYQIGLEFHANRLTVIRSLNNAYAALLEVIESNFEKPLKGQIQQFKKHPSILVDNIIKLYTEFLKKISSELEKQKKNHPDFIKKDHILDELTTLFENKVGKEFSKEILKKIYVDGKERYDQLIPPGFKDLEAKKKKGDRHVYGDYIIWNELIEFTKKEKKPLIFVTDDRKEDWWTIENGETIRPREELVKEFFDLTGIRILIYNADNFLHYAKERKLVPSIKDETIEEVKEIRKSDEINYGILELLQSGSYRDGFVATQSFADLLRSGAYEKLFTTGIPASAYLQSVNPLTVGLVGSGFFQTANPITGGLATAGSIYSTSPITGSFATTGLFDPTGFIETGLGNLDLSSPVSHPVLVKSPVIATDKLDSKAKSSAADIFEGAESIESKEIPKTEEKGPLST